MVIKLVCFHIRLTLFFLREKRLAKKYYDKLFKEYCICDLSHWEEKKIAMRWRIDKEVVSGKGKFVSD